MKFFASISLLLALVSCSKQEKSSSSTRSDTTEMAPPVGLPGSANQARQPASSPARSAAWRYEKTVDATGNPVRKASITALNTLRFPYPYTGASTATLTIRTANGSTYAYIEVSNGQFNRSFQNGSARVRFDGRPPVAYALSAAANGRANIVFFDSEQTLIDRLKTARRTAIQISFPGQRTQEITLNTAGLQWNR